MSASQNSPTNATAAASNAPTVSSFEKLPTEIKRAICSLVDGPQALLNLSLTCRTLRQITAHFLDECLPGAVAEGRAERVAQCSRPIPQPAILKRLVSDANEEQRKQKRNLERCLKWYAAIHGNDTLLLHLLDTELSLCREERDSPRHTSKQRPDKQVLNSAANLKLLHAAAAEGKEAVVRLLIAKGVRDRTEVDQPTAISFAAENGHANIISFLLQYGARTAAVEGFWKPLQSAMRGRHVDATRVLLLAYGPSLRTRSGYNPMFVETAVESGSADIVKLVLEHTLTTDETRPLPYRPLSIAVAKGYTEVAELLLRSGVNVRVDSGLRQPPLHLAVDVGNVNMIKLLCEFGADVDGRDRHGWTALQAAVSNGRTEIAELLFRNHARMDVVGENGATAPQYERYYSPEENSDDIDRGGEDRSSRKRAASEPCPSLGKRQCIRKTR